MARRHQSRSTVPCPKCRRIVHTGDTFCSFCGESLQVQCPTCGQWTKSNHNHCPDCGSSLKGGLSYEQQQNLSALRAQRQAIIAERTLGQQRLEELYAQRQRAYLRAFVVAGLLLCAVAIVVNLFEGLTSTITGMIVLVAAAWIFRFVIPGFVGALWSVCSWAFPEIRPIRQAITEQERSLRDLQQAAHEVKGKIAVLRKQEASKPTPQAVDFVPDEESEPEEEDDVVDGDEKEEVSKPLPQATDLAPAEKVEDVADDDKEASPEEEAPQAADLPLRKTSRKRSMRARRKK